MSHTHSTPHPATIAVARWSEEEGAEPRWYGCFGWHEGDDQADIERRWNAFAQQMWMRGLEPDSDEPYFTDEQDGVIIDYYPLKVINEDNE